MCWRERNADASASFPLAILYHAEQDPKTEPIPGNLRIATLVDCASSHCLTMLEVLWLELSPTSKKGFLVVAWGCSGLPTGSFHKPCISAVVLICSCVVCCKFVTFLPLHPGCREQVIQPMGITPSGNLAPMENAIRDMADERSSSDSDLGLD